jgi:hypothetical protein
MKKDKKFMKKKHIEERKKAYALLLMLPPLAALIMIGVITFTEKTLVVAPEGLMLSPVKDSSPLIISLTIFIVGYFVFVGFLFKDDVKQAWYHKILRKH